MSRTSQPPATSKLHEQPPEEADSDSNSERHSAEEGEPTLSLPQVRRSLRNRSENEESSEPSELEGSSGSEEKAAAKAKPKARTTQRKSNRLNTGLFQDHSLLIHV